MGSKLSLVEFVEQFGGRPKTAWADTLPDEIQNLYFTEGRCTEIALRDVTEPDAELDYERTV